MTTFTLSARIDEKESGRIIFNRLVTLDEARRYLWGHNPPPDALSADPADMSSAGKRKHYLIKKGDLGLLMSLQHGLANEYLKRLQIITSNAPADLPQWIPPSVRQRVLSGALPSGVSRFPGTKPWGDVVVWINRSGGYVDIQVYQEYPEEIDFYLDVAGQDGRKARLLHQVYTGYNKDMRYFVEEKQLSPDMSRSEIRRINDELFKLVIEASVSMLTSGAAISAITSSVRSSAGKVIAVAEKQNFASTRHLSAIQEVQVSQEMYRKALSRIFPSHQLDPVARLVDDIGQRAAERVANNPNFLRAVTKQDWKAAGNMFHDAAKQEARAVPTASLPNGWRVTAEETLQSGKGGSRLDVFLRGPGGELVEVDWKTSGVSALSSRTVKQMEKHAGHIHLKAGGSVTSQESRSWIDYVRPHFPNMRW